MHTLYIMHTRHIVLCYYIAPLLLEFLPPLKRQLPAVPAPPSPWQLAEAGRAPQDNRYPAAAKKSGCAGASPAGPAPAGLAPAGLAPAGWRRWPRRCRGGARRANGVGSDTQTSRRPLSHTTAKIGYKYRAKCIERQHPGMHQFHNELAACQLEAQRGVSDSSTAGWSWRSGAATGFRSGRNG